MDCGVYGRAKRSDADPLQCDRNEIQTNGGQAKTQQRTLDVGTGSSGENGRTSDTSAFRERWKYCAAVVDLRRVCELACHSCIVVTSRFIVNENRLSSSITLSSSRVYHTSALDGGRFDSGIGDCEMSAPLRG